MNEERNRTADSNLAAKEVREGEDKRVASDLFYHGTIQRLFPKSNTGIVRTSSGREIPFSYQLVDMFGPVKKPQDLREGLVVGFDMAWTSEGLKVTKIKTYRRAPEEPGDAKERVAADLPGDSEGK